MKRNSLQAIICAILAALFYALNAPLSKYLLNDISPTYLASFLYLGAGIGVGILYLFHYKKEDVSKRLSKKDLPYTIGMIVLDIIAPILLMMGINIGNSSNASLLSNFEIVATTLIAWIIFKEKISKKLGLAIFLIFVSSILVSFEGSGSFQFSKGSLFVLLATCCWGLENNCTRNISNKSSYEIVTVKGLCSGMGSFIVAKVIGERLPNVQYIFYALLLGFVAYGLSIFLYVKAQNGLGAAKTSAYYAIAPFIGVLLSFAINKEPITIQFVIALLIMVVGTILVVQDTLVEKHSHMHSHVIRHVHDGVVHTHVITHEHPHRHFIDDEKHGHTHTLEELEEELKKQHEK